MEPRTTPVEIINIIFYLFDRIKPAIISRMETHDGLLTKKCQGRVLS